MSEYSMHLRKTKAKRSHSQIVKRIIRLEDILAAEREALQDFDHIETEPWHATRGEM